MEVGHGWHGLWPLESRGPVGTTSQTLSQRRLRRGNPTHQSAELAPVPSRQGGHSPTEAGASVSADQPLQATQANGPPPLLPLPLGQAGPASLSPLPPPPPHAPSARRIKSRPRPGIQGHQDPPHQPPHQLLHPVPRRLQSPHCSLMSSTHTDHWAFVHAALGPDALPFHPPLSHCCFEASSRVSSIRQYWWRVADMPGAVQGTHEPPDHPDPT